MQTIKIQPNSTLLKIVDFLGFQNKIFTDFEYTKLKKFAHEYESGFEDDEYEEYEKIIRGDLLKSTRKDILVYFIYQSFEKKETGHFTYINGEWVEEKKKEPLLKITHVLALNKYFNIIYDSSLTVSLSIPYNENERMNPKVRNEYKNKTKNIEKLVSPEIYSEMLSDIKNYRLLLYKSED